MTAWMGSNVIIKILVQVGSLLLRFLYKDFSDDSSKTEFKLVAYTWPNELKFLNRSVKGFTVFPRLFCPFYP